MNLLNHRLRVIRLLALPVLAAILSIALAGAVAASDLPAPPPRHFHDAVGLVDPAEGALLADALSGYEQRTGIQFVVAVLPEIDGDLEDYVNRLYEGWAIGDKQTQRGVLLAVFPEQRRSRLEVGYGLEGAVPDVRASRLLRQMTEIPSSEPGRRLASVMVGVARLATPEDPLAQGQIGREPDRRSAKRGLRSFLLPLLLFFLIGGGGYGRRRWLGPLILMSALSGGGSRGGFGGGGGGGGFSGRGGFSGGGGASGGW